MLVMAAVSLALLTQDPVAPPERQLGEHSKPIQQIAVSPDGSVLVTAAPGEIHAWDPTSGEALWKHELKSADLPVVALGVGGKLVVHHMGMAAAFLLDLATGESKSGLGGTTAMRSSRCLVVDARDRWIWMGTDVGVMTRVVPGNVNAWSNRNLENGGVRALALDAAGKTLAVGGSDGSVRFINAQSARVDDKKVLSGHAEAVSALAMDPKGTLIASASEAGDLRTWRYANARQQHLLKESGAVILRLAIDPKGTMLAAGDAEGRVEIWDLKKAKLLTTLTPAGEGAVTGLVFAPKRTNLVASRAGTQATLWDLSDL